MRKVLLIILAIALIFIMGDYFQIPIISDITGLLKGPQVEMYDEEGSIVLIGEGWVKEDANHEALYKKYKDLNIVYMNVNDFKRYGYTVHYDHQNRILSMIGYGNDIVIDEDKNTLTWNNETQALPFGLYHLNNQIYYPINEMGTFESNGTLNDLGFIVQEENQGVMIKSKYADKYTANAQLDENIEKPPYLYLDEEGNYPNRKIKNEEVYNVFPTLENDLLLLNMEALIPVVTEEGKLLYIEGVFLNDLNKSIGEDYSETFLKFPETINLTWDGILVKRDFEELVGVNIISPTWYSLQSVDGDIRSIYSSSYQEEAEANGLEVWPLVSNSFDLELTHGLLNNYYSRQKFIDKIISESEKYNFKGINIDFENIYLRDRDAFSHFMNELAQETRKRNIILSVDVTVLGGSETWSLSSDRVALGNIVDYMFIMTYDQYWKTSPVSGPVASYDWMENSLIAIKKIVPKEKIVMGIPLYTRVWYESPSEQVVNHMDVYAKDYYMTYIMDVVEEKELEPLWDDKSQQWYYVYMEEGYLKKMWLEEPESVAIKANLMKKLDLAGVSTWQRDFAAPEVWENINNEIK